jgi:hypothetical protein
MAKKVIRLNESEMVKLVEKIVRKVNKKPLRESNFDRNGGDSYQMDVRWTIGEEDSRFNLGYTEGLLTVNIPKSRFRQIIRRDIETIGSEKRYDLFSDEGADLAEFAFDNHRIGNYIRCVDADTGEEIRPDLMDSIYTTGVIIVRNV